MSRPQDVGLVLGVVRMPGRKVVQSMYVMSGMIVQQLVPMMHRVIVMGSMMQMR